MSNKCDNWTGQAYDAYGGVKLSTSDVIKHNIPGDLFCVVSKREGRQDECHAKFIDICVRWL